MRKKQTSRRIGILGGLFDPPHIGHLIIAQAVLEEFSLDTILFVPAGNPPHKSRYSPYTVRYAMTARAIKNNKNFGVSDIEKRISGKTYTIDVIRQLKKTNRGTLHLIMGSDQWSEIKTWRAPHALLRECTIIVVPRTGYRISKSNHPRRAILISSAPRIDISSTLIRKRVRGRRSIQYLVTPAVYTYIKEHKLYEE